MPTSTVVFKYPQIFKDSTVPYALHSLTGHFSTLTKSHNNNLYSPLSDETSPCVVLTNQRATMTVTVDSEVLELRKPEKDDKSSPPSQSIHSIPTWSLSSRLQPSEVAAFSVTSRLLASIVTESLLDAYYIPILSEEIRGICVLFSTHMMEEHPIPTGSLCPADVFAIIPLHQEPVCFGTPTRHGTPIWLLDPLDMIPSVFELSTREDDLAKYVCFIRLDCSLEYLLIYDSLLSRRAFYLA